MIQFWRANFFSDGLVQPPTRDRIVDFFMVDDFDDGTHPGARGADFERRFFGT